MLEKNTDLYIDNDDSLEEGVDKIYSSLSINKTLGFQKIIKDIEMMIESIVIYKVNESTS